MRKSGRVRKSTWNNWQEGMRTNFSLPIFIDVSKEVFEELPDIFTELRKVMAQNYSTDPKEWK